jgi:hypothetical protein
MFNLQGQYRVLLPQIKDLLPLILVCELFVYLQSTSLLLPWTFLWGTISPLSIPSMLP